MLTQPISKSPLRKQSKGRFNLCLLKTESSNYLQPNSFSSASLIDHAFVNNPDQAFISGSTITDISDHFSQFCILKSIREKTVKKTIEWRDFSQLSSSEFNNDLAMINKNDIIVSKANNIDGMFASFKRKLPWVPEVSKKQYYFGLLRKK